MSHDVDAASAASHFDRYARSYDGALQQGLAVSGEGREYFARRRVEFLAKGLRAQGVQVRSVLDYGCGTGDTSPILAEAFPEAEVTGFDVSAESVAVAQSSHRLPRLRFTATPTFRSAGEFDLVYCNGIFHHIPPDQRVAVVAQIAAALRPGGRFSLWENNPWNPGTRLVMSRIPFDRDAITLSVIEARQLVGGSGLQIVGTDFLFIFPRALRWLRGLEEPASRLPLGAQYQVLGARSPSGPTLRAS